MYQKVIATSFIKTSDSIRICILSRLVIYIDGGLNSSVAPQGSLAESYTDSNASDPPYSLQIQMNSEISV